MAYCRRYLRIQNIDKTSSKAKESIKEMSFAGYFYENNILLQLILTIFT